MSYRSAQVMTWIVRVLRCHFISLCSLCSLCSRYSLYSLCAVSCLLASQPLISSAQEVGYEQQLDRIKLYISDELYLPALNELKLLSKTPQGRDDVRVFIALAKVSYKLHDITSAFSYLGRARALPSKALIREKLTELYREWLRYYGLVRFESANAQTRGVVTLIRKRRQVVSAERREILRSSIERFARGVDLPSVAYLPYGHYTANGTPFHLKRREMNAPMVEILLPPVEQEKEESKVSQLNWLYIGIGGALITAAGVGGYFLLNDDSPPPTRRLDIIVVP